MNELAQQIRSYLVEHFLFGVDNGMPDDASFLELGVVDSTGVLEMVAHLESTYGIKVSDDELTPDNLDSIDAICAYIARKRAAASTVSS